MADTKTISRALAILAEVWPRPLTPELVKIYQVALQDVDDETVLRAVRRAVTESKFFPVPAELRTLAGVDRQLVVDAEALLDRIAGLGQYHPASGMRWPSAAAVRQLVGEHVGDAYAVAGGGARLFSGHETTRGIARREFAQDFKRALEVHGRSALPLPAQACLPAAASGTFADRPAMTGPAPIAQLLAERVA